MDYIIMQQGWIMDIPSCELNGQEEGQPLHFPALRGRTGSRMFIETIAGTTILTIEDTSNEEDPHVYNHISNPSYNQLHEYMAI